MPSSDRTLSHCEDCDNPAVVGYGLDPDYQTIWLCRWHFIQRFDQDPHPSQLVKVMP